MSILLVGSPNSGKTTLFNRLTGLGAKTVNYPGSTVDLLVGRVAKSDPVIEAVDTPGIYSLHPRSPDERITERSILERPWARIVVVVDVTQMGRQLAIVRQLKQGLEKLGVSSEEFRDRVLVALTMGDLLSDGGKSLRLESLKEELGLRVILVPHRDHDLENSELWSWVHDDKARNDTRPDTRNYIRWEKPELAKAGSSVFPPLELKESKRLKDLVFGFSSGSSSEASGGSSDSSSNRSREVTRKLDRFSLHPILGPVVFVLVMAFVFSMIFWAAQPLMEIFESAFSWASETVLELSFVNPDHPLTRLFTDGIIAGGGAVAVFIPQIFILFLGLVFLEDSGYLSRAATIVDQPLKKVGLGGRSFVPLLSGFACAVPAMLASRAINSRLERMTALFAIPLMSCSARLPVYALLLAFLFPTSPGIAGLVLTALYFGSVVSGVVAAGVLSRMMEKREPGLMARSFLALELPIYRRPRARHVFFQAWLRTKSYVKRTGPLIVLLSILIWGGTNFPHFYSQDPADRLKHSYAGRLGHYLSPVFEPMGGDWRTGLGLISAFAAREVFVSTMAVIFHGTDEDESKLQAGLLGEMREARNKEGALLFTPASVAGLLVFFVIAMQCLSTFAVATKESGSLKFAIGQLVAFNLVAYFLSVSVVQGLRAIGIP